MVSLNKLLPLLVGISTLTLGGASALAEPAPVFDPYLPTILEQAPTQTIVRLPPQILLSSPANFDANRLHVRVIAAETPPILTVNLMTCETGVFPCLVGSIVLESHTSANAQRELQRHQAAAAPITLDAGITGYFLDGTRQTPAYGFSSIMWLQDNTIYTLSFPATERQNLLYMALQMARSGPLFPPLAPLTPRTSGTTR